jgi:hypothetical protein
MGLKNLQIIKLDLPMHIFICRSNVKAWLRYAENDTAICRNELMYEPLAFECGIL